MKRKKRHINERIFEVRVSSVCLFCVRYFINQVMPVKPAVYGFGLVTIAEKSVIPSGVKIGKNTAISGETTVEDYPDGELASGGAIVKKDGE